MSDRDKVFLSHFWTELLRLQGTFLHRNTAYHPQSDGRIVVVNRCGSILAMFHLRQSWELVFMAALAEYWFNHFSCINEDYTVSSLV